MFIVVADDGGNSKILGAVGVSGGTPQQDGQVAQACVEAFPGIVQGR